MADDTTGTANSQTTTDQTAAADAAGGADAQAGGADTGTDGNDTSLLGDAGAATGSGDSGTDGAAKDEAGKDGEGKTDGPPESYELTVTTKDAEGKDVPVEIDTALLEKATPLFKAAGLTNDQANQLAPLAIEIQNRVAARQNDEFAAMKADWAKAAKADVEIGGAKWSETEALAGKALDALGAPKGSEFRTLLDESGFGNHPEMIRIFRRAGERIVEDPGTTRSDAAKTVKPAAEEVLYPDDIKQGAK